MARALTAAFEAATQANHVRPVMLLELMLTVPVRLWTGIGDIFWSGATWTGAGNLLGVGSVQETQELRAAGMDISLSAIPSEMLSLALVEPYQGKAARVYIGAFNVNTGALITDPYMIFGGRIDTVNVIDGAEEATISVALENRLIDLERPRERRYDDADQQAEHPGDRFFEFVPSLQDQEIKWGKG
jgi:hypothetical protein